MLELQPIMEVNHTTPEKYVRPALDFWAQAYRAGVRITVASDGFSYGWVCTWQCRISEAQAFGVFPESKPVPPPEWIVEGTQKHAASLKTLLGQPVPKPYQRFANHLLLLDQELKPIEAHARRQGYQMRGAGVDGGYFLMYHGECPRHGEDYTPVTPNIISKYKGISI
jgi:hypothetical protein